MSKYTEILGKVQEYLQDDNNPEVQEGEITLYELYSVLEKTIEELYKEKESEELLQEVNNENTIIKKIGRIFKKEIVENLNKYKKVLLMYDENETQIAFLGDYGSEVDFDIYKDNESDELYTKYGTFTKEEKELVDAHHDEILDILKSLQEYRDLTGINRSYSPYDKKTQTISDGFIEATITYNYYGMLKMEMNVKETIDPEKVSSRSYFNQDKIQDVIDDNKREISKKIVIDENELNEGCQKILRRSRADKHE